MCLVCGGSRNGNIWVGGQIDFILDYLPKAGKRKNKVSCWSGNVYVRWALQLALEAVLQDLKELHRSLRWDPFRTSCSTKNQIDQQIINLLVTQLLLKEKKCIIFYYSRKSIRNSNIRTCLMRSRSKLLY